MHGALELAAIRMYLTFGLAALAIVLGFVALLKQRTYLDAKTQKPVQIDIPLLGKNIKMKTNYPALAFLFLGFLLVIYVLRIEFPSEKIELDWSVEGSFVDPNINDWDRAGTLGLFPPQKIQTQGQPVDRNGYFNIIVKIEKDKTFEQVVQKITYSHREGQVIIIPAQEYSAYERHEESCKLELVTQNTRKYRSLPLERFPARNN